MAAGSVVGCARGISTFKAVDDASRREAACKTGFSCCPGITSSNREASMLAGFSCCPGITGARLTGSSPEKKKAAAASQKLPKGTRVAPPAAVSRRQIDHVIMQHDVSQAGAFFSPSRHHVPHPKWPLHAAPLSSPLFGFGAREEKLATSRLAGPLSQQHSPRYRRLQSLVCHWRRKDTRNIDGRSKALIRQLKGTSNVREEVYGVLDTWSAFQLDFPMLAIKTAINELRKAAEWERIIQICKWMLSKGQGKTFGTYESLMEALCEERRLEEMDGMWDRLLEKRLESIPRSTFARVMELYSKKGRHEKVVEVFGSLEALDINPDERILQLVETSLLALNAPRQAQEILERYPLMKVEYRFVDGIRCRVKVAIPRRGLNLGRDGVESQLASNETS